MTGENNHPPHDQIADDVPGEAFGRAIIDALPAHIAVLDNSGTIIGANIAWVRFATENGLPNTRSVYAGVNYLDICRQAAEMEDPLAREALEGIESVLSGRAQIFSLEYPCHSPTEQRWFAMDVRRSENAAVTVVAHRNITARKRSDARLAESERKYRELVEHANSIILRWTYDGRITFLNEFGQRFFGYSAEEVVGRHVMDTIVANTDNEGHDLRQLMDQICANPVAYEQNVNENVRRNGERVWIAWTNKIVQDTQGQVTEIFSVGTDITERKRAEDELKQSRDELELRVQKRTNELSQMIQRLQERSEQLRQMAAELTITEQRERQQLSSILHDGLQQILVGAKFRLASIGRSQIEHCATDEVAKLIDEAIETSRSLTAEMSPPILLQKDLFSALEWLARWMHDKHRLDVKLVTHSQTPPALREELFFLLFQATRELLFNVVKHAGVRAAQVEVNQLDGQIVLQVTDEGAGFDPTTLHTELIQPGGMGLFGISERLSYMGGRMEIDSAPGRGSQFKLIVTRSAVSALMDRPPAKKQVQAAGVISARLKSKPSCTGKSRVLLVDDHMVMRQGLAGLISREPDLEVVGEASDGESAIKLIRDIMPDIVLMDISMPGMDGIQATRIIHKELPEIRIIGLSMFQEGEQQAAMREAGAVDYLTKSGPSEALIEAIRACIPVSE